MVDDPARIGPVIDPLDDAREGMRMIREFVELHAPPGTLPARLHTGLRATEEAEAIIGALRKTSLPFSNHYCLHCHTIRPMTFEVLPANAMNPKSSAEIVCAVCNSIAVTLQE